MSALYVKFSLRNVSTDHAPAITAGSTQTSVIKLDEWANGLTTVDVQVVPGVVLEIQVVFDADAATTLIEDGEPTWGSEPGVPSGDIDNGMGVLPSSNNAGVVHNVIEAIITTQLGAITGGEGGTFIDSSSSLAGEGASVVRALDYATSRANVEGLQPPCWESTASEVVGGDVWAVANIIAGIGLSADDVGYSPVLTELSSQSDQANFDGVNAEQLEEESPFVTKESHMELQMDDFDAAEAM